MAAGQMRLSELGRKTESLYEYILVVLMNSFFGSSTTVQAWSLLLAAVKN